MPKRHYRNSLQSQLTTAREQLEHWQLMLLRHQQGKPTIPLKNIAGNLGYYRNLIKSITRRLDTERKESPSLWPR